MGSAGKLIHDFLSYLGPFLIFRSLYNFVF